MKYLSIHPVEIKPAKQIYIVYIEAIEIKKKTCMLLYGHTKLVVYAIVHQHRGWCVYKHVLFDIKPVPECRTGKSV